MATAGNRPRLYSARPHGSMAMRAWRLGILGPYGADARPCERRQSTAGLPPGRRPCTCARLMGAYLAPARPRRGRRRAPRSGAWASCRTSTSCAWSRSVAAAWGPRAAWAARFCGSLDRPHTWTGAPPRARGRSSMASAAPLRLPSQGPTDEIYGNASISIAGVCAAGWLLVCCRRCIRH